MLNGQAGLCFIECKVSEPLNIARSKKPGQKSHLWLAKHFAKEVSILFMVGCTTFVLDGKVLADRGLSNVRPRQRNIALSSRSDPSLQGNHGRNCIELEMLTLRTKLA